MIIPPWALELIGNFTETIFEKIAPTASMKSLSKRVKSEERAFNLIVTGLLYTPILLIVVGTLWKQSYFWSILCVLLLIGIVIWCSYYVRNELRYQDRKDLHDGV